MNSFRLSEQERLAEKRYALCLSFLGFIHGVIFTILAYFVACWIWKG